MAVDLSTLDALERDLDRALLALDLAEHSLGDSEAPVARLLRPSIRLFTEQLSVNRGDVFRPEIREVDAPVIELCFEYPGCTVSAGPDEPLVHTTRDGSAFARDLDAEAQARRTLERFGALDLTLLDDYGAPPDSRAHYLVQSSETRDAFCSFTANALPQLRELGFKIFLERDYPYRVLPKEPDWYAVVEEADKPDWFSLELGIDLDGHRVNLLPVLLGMLEEGFNPHEQSSSLSTRFVQIPGPGRGQHVAVPPERLRVLLQVLGELYQEQAPRKEGGRGKRTKKGKEEANSTPEFPGARAGALSQIEGAFEAEETHFSWEAPNALQERQALAAAPKDLREYPRMLRAQLRPYQRTGVAFLQHLRQHNAGGVLADDMGLGKTLQTIAHLCLEHDGMRVEVPSLIIAPTSLAYNWERELAKFAPGLRVCALHGHDRFERRNEASDADVCITTYPVLLRDADYFSSNTYHYVILDEAQTIKNHRSRAHAVVRNLSSQHRLCLTGTPIENGLTELWSLFDFLMPGLLGDDVAFRQFYRIPIEQQRDEDRLALLREQVSPYILRRLKRDVAKELPEKTEIVRAVELCGRQRELYESIRVAAHQHVRTAIRKSGVAGSTLKILEALTKLRQLCCDPRLVKSEAAARVGESAKYELFFELLEGLLAGGHRVLVFSQFTSMLALLGEGLRERKIDYLTLTGSTMHRQKPCDAFERGEADVFLISLKAGGTGLNLVSADTVIHYDPWWNPAAQDQATDRAYRIGQRRQVFVYNLVTAGSVEERMLALQQRKRELAQSVLAAPGEMGALLGEAEVEQLFAPLQHVAS